MSNFTFTDLFGEKEIKENSGSNYKNLVPETEILEDGSISIKDFVKGVAIDSIVFNEEKNQAEITFSKDGATIRKYISDPESRSYIQNEADETKKTQDIKNVYLELQRLVSNYVYNNTVLKTIKEIPSITFKFYVEALGKLIESGESRTPDEVYLKITFKETQAVAPSYIIPNYAYIGKGDQWGPKWSKDNEKSNSSKGYGFTNFLAIEKTPDFSNDINDIFSTPEITLL